MKFWTDGACFPNPGKGGWGWTDLNGTHDCGGEPDTTNQRMEMKAAIQCLSHCLEFGVDEPLIISDSQYVVMGCTEWRQNWEESGWLNSKGKPVVNQDLWKCLHGLADITKAKFQWVRGHTGDPGNEEADRLSVIGSGCTQEEIKTAERKLKALKTRGSYAKETV